MQVDKIAGKGGTNASALEKDIGPEQFPINEHYFGLVNVDIGAVHWRKCNQSLITEPIKELRISQTLQGALPHSTPLHSSEKFINIVLR
ncbi:ubiquitin carboxyl-terminal hydrolase 46 isoform X1 [Tachysurus ichikawai]